MQDEEIKVAVFEDNTDYREGLCQILNASFGFKCVAAYSHCNNVVAHVRSSRPDIVLMDIQMPGMSGIEALPLLKREFPELPILMQTVFEDENKVFSAICAGANGYILKNIPVTRMLDAIKEVAAGGSSITPSIAAKVLQMFKEQNHAAPVDTIDLTRREKEILNLLVKGNSYKMIAAELCISYETVHSHIKKIYQKLQVNSLNEAIGKAIRNKLTS